MSSILQAQQLYTAGIPLLEAYLLPMANHELAMNVSPPPATWSRFICMHVFHGVKKMTDLSCSRMPYKTGNALALQRSIFRENRLKFRPSSTAEKVSIVCGMKKHVKSEMLSNRHTDTHTHTHRPSTVTLAAHARRG